MLQKLLEYYTPMAKDLAIRYPAKKEFWEY